MPTQFHPTQGPFVCSRLGRGLCDRAPLGRPTHGVCGEWETVIRVPKARRSLPFAADMTVKAFGQCSTLLGRIRDGPLAPHLGHPSGRGVWVWVWVGTLAPYCTTVRRRVSVVCSGGLSGSMRPDVHHCCLRNRQVKRVLCPAHTPPSRSATCSATLCPQLGGGGRGGGAPVLWRAVCRCPSPRKSSPLVMSKSAIQNNACTSRENTMNSKLCTTGHACGCAAAGRGGPALWAPPAPDGWGGAQGDDVCGHERGSSRAPRRHAPASPGALHSTQIGVVHALRHRPPQFWWISPHYPPPTEAWGGGSAAGDLGSDTLCTPSLNTGGGGQALAHGTHLNTALTAPSLSHTPATRPMATHMTPAHPMPRTHRAAPLSTAVHTTMDASRAGGTSGTQRWSPTHLVRPKEISGRRSRRTRRLSARLQYPGGCGVRGTIGWGGPRAVPPAPPCAAGKRSQAMHMPLYSTGPGPLPFNRQAFPTAALRCPTRAIRTLGPS